MVQDVQPGELAALSFDRTIDRRQVHRSAVSEVFVTDVRPLGEGRVAVAAQRPTCHAYFDDHDPPAGVDAMLIMEVCRQAGLATAYALGVSTDVVLVTGEWDLRLAPPAQWGTGLDLRIDSAFTWTRMRRGRPRAGTCRQHVYAAGRPVATLHATSQLLDYGELEMLRTAQRGTPPPHSGDLDVRPDPQLADPASVGRRSAGNVVLARLARDGDVVSARVALPLANRALFDHSYDHVTMQVLIEAARQLAVSQWPGRAVTRLAGRFARFAELDAPVTVHATAAAPQPRSEQGTTFGVLVQQYGDAVAELELTMVDPEGNGHG